MKAHHKMPNRLITNHKIAYGTWPFIFHYFMMIGLTLKFELGRQIDRGEIGQCVPVVRLGC